MKLESIFEILTDVWELDVTVIFNKINFVMRGAGKVCLKKENTIYLLTQTVPLLTTVTEDVTSHIVPALRFMGSSSGRWHVVSE